MRKIKISGLDHLFGVAVKCRDKWQCQRCKARFAPFELYSCRALHCSHYIGRANKKTRYNFANCTALCYGCHQYFETHKGTDYRDFMIKRLGQEGYDEFIKESREKVLFDDKAKKDVAEMLKRVMREI